MYGVPPLAKRRCKLERARAPLRIPSGTAPVRLHWFTVAPSCVFRDVSHRPESTPGAIGKPKKETSQLLGTVCFRVGGSDKRGEGVLERGPRNERCGPRMEVLAVAGTPLKQVRGTTRREMVAERYLPIKRTESAPRQGVIGRPVLCGLQYRDHFSGAFPLPVAKGARSAKGLPRPSCRCLSFQMPLPWQTPLLTRPVAGNRIRVTHGPG